MSSEFINAYFLYIYICQKKEVEWQNFHLELHFYQLMQACCVKCSLLLLQIHNISTVEQLHSILVEDDVLDVLSQVGYRGVPSREKLECKEGLVR